MKILKFLTGKVVFIQNGFRCKAARFFSAFLLIFALSCSAFLATGCEKNNECLESQPQSTADANENATAPDKTDNQRGIEGEQSKTEGEQSKNESENIEKKYAVFYVDNTLYQVSLLGGKPRFTPAVPERKGYTGEWKEVESGVPQEMSFVAEYEPIVYKIVFYTQRGELPEEEKNPITYTVETESFEFPIPTRKEKVEYKFCGWYTDEKYENEIKGITKGDVGDLYVYAKWEALS